MRKPVYEILLLIFGAAFKCILLVSIVSSILIINIQKIDTYILFSALH